MLTAPTPVATWNARVDGGHTELVGRFRGNATSPCHIRRLRRRRQIIRMVESAASTMLKETRAVPIIHTPTKSHVTSETPVEHPESFGHLRTCTRMEVFVHVRE